MTARRQITLSDGTVVELRAPGVGFSIEAENGIPDLGAFLELAATSAKVKSKQAKEREAAAAASRELESKRRMDVWKYGELLIEHGTVAPRFAVVPGEGQRGIRDLLEPDFHALVQAISELRGEALTRSAEHYRPSVAAPESSARPDNAASSSEPDRAAC